MSEQNPLSPIELIRPRLLARTLGVDPSTISKMLKDGRLPPKRIVCGIGGWLRGDIESLFGVPQGKTEPTPADPITANKR